MNRKNTLVTIKSDDYERPLSLRLSIAQTGGYVGPNGIRRGVYTRIWAIAEGGAGGYVRTIVDGSLPTGMGPMDPATGESYGTPTQSGRWEFTVRVQDAAATVAEARFAVRVLSSLVPIEVAPTKAAPGVPYNYQMRVSDPAATWALVSGTLPGGLSLAADGTISGTPGLTANEDSPDVHFAVLRASIPGDVLDVAISLTVCPEMIPDAIRPGPPVVVQVGDVATFDGPGLRGGCRPLRYQATESIPSFVTVDPATGAITARPTAGDVGLYQSLAAQVTDGAQSVVAGYATGIRVTPRRKRLTVGADTLPTDSPGLEQINFTGAGVTVTPSADGTVVDVDIPGGNPGTVTSVGLSGGSTGLSVAGSPVTGAGTMTLGGTLALAHGGTGATTAAQARANLGAMQDTTVPVSKGGTGATTAAAARSNLGALGNVTGTSPITVSGSGDSRTVSHANSGVAAGTYTNATVTVNAQGHVTSASSGTGGGGTWGSITGNIASQADLQSALNGKGGLGTQNSWVEQQSFAHSLRVGSWFTTRMLVTAAGAVTMDATTAGNMRTAIGAVAATGTASQVINGNGTMRNITVSTAMPSGGSDGDIWFRV